MAFLKAIEKSKFNKPEDEKEEEQVLKKAKKLIET